MSYEHVKTNETEFHIFQRLLSEATKQVFAREKEFIDHFVMPHIKKYYNEIDDCEITYFYMSGSRCLGKFLINGVSYYKLVIKTDEFLEWLK